MEFIQRQWFPTFDTSRSSITSEHQQYYFYQLHTPQSATSRSAPQQSGRVTSEVGEACESKRTEKLRDANFQLMQRRHFRSFPSLLPFSFPCFFSFTFFIFVVKRYKLEIPFSVLYSRMTELYISPFHVPQSCL